MRGRPGTALAPLSPQLLVRRTETPQLTMAECVPQFLGWLKGYRRRAENTCLAYGRDLRMFTEFCRPAGLVLPGDVTDQVVEGYLAALMERGGRKESTANRHRYALQQFFLFLRKVGAVTSNPVEMTFVIPQPKTLPDYLTVPEQDRVLTTLARGRTLQARRDFAVIATAMLTGLRCEEICHLRVEDVDLEAGKLRVVAGKGRKDRESVVIPRLAVILRAYLATVRPELLGGVESPWVFVHVSSRGGAGSHRRRAGQPLLTRSVFHLVRRVVSDIVGRPVHPHALRHSFASRLRWNGADLQLIQEALGHANIGTTTRYAHLPTEKRSQQIAKLLR